MARKIKKKTSKKKAAPKKRATPKKKTTPKKKRVAALSEERTHKLTRPQLLKWRTLFAEMQGSSAKAESSKYKLMDAQRKFNQAVQGVPALASLQGVLEGCLGDLAVYQKEVKERKAVHSEYVQSLCDKLGFPGKNIAIDDETGIIREIDGG